MIMETVREVLKYMSIIYCENCDSYVDTDFNAEHFDEYGEKELSNKENNK